MKTPAEAVALILEAEGVNQPGTWPGEQSGITLGFGYDLGYNTRNDLLRDWSRHLSAAQLEQLAGAVGKTAGKAEAIAPRFRDIKISRVAALEVFNRATLPKFEAQTAEAFPGVSLLPDFAFGALVSLVFNRGAAMEGERRREMASIRNAIRGWSTLNPTGRASSARVVLLTVAAQIRSMKRLWQGKGLDGLLTRRENEARLVEKAAVGLNLLGVF